MSGVENSPTHSFSQNLSSSRTILNFCASMDQSLDPLKILDVDTKAIAGKYILDGKPYEEWDKLNEKRDAQLNDQTEVVKPFGNIRLDSMNKPQFHGQFDPENDRPKLDMNELERQVSAKVAANPASELEMEEEAQDSSQSTPKEKERAEVAPEFTEKFPLVSSRSAPPSKMAQFDFKHSDFWDEIRNTTEKTVSASTIHFLARYSEMVERKQRANKPEGEQSLLEAAKLAKNEPIESSDQILQELDSTDEPEFEPQIPSPSTSESKASPVVEDDEEVEEKVITAHEYLEKLKEGKIEHQSLAAKKLLEKVTKPSLSLDSQGFNSFIRYAPVLSDLRRSEIIKLLAESVLFCDNGLLIINKPYGLISQGKSSDHPRDPTFNLPELLPDLTQELLRRRILKGDETDLSVCHRLDKSATGVLVLATTKSVASKVQEIFAERKVFKEYLTITRGVPDPASAVIDIPIEEGLIGGKERMVLRPTLREELRRIAAPSKMAKRAVTSYSVVDAKGSAALLKITTQTGVKHQIRVHLGFGLRCPILGDHKYSHLTSLTPQKLPSDMLMSLNVRPAKVRNIPLHLHAQVIFLPEMGRNKTTVVARAPIPGFFAKTMSMLKLVKR